MVESLILARAHGAGARLTIDKKALVQKVSVGFVLALNDLRDVVGPANWAKILPVPAQDAADYVFYRERA